MLPVGYFEFTLQLQKESGEIIKIERRYSDFLLLRKCLECLHPGLFVFPLPPKDKFISFQKEDSESVQARK
jgi:hypothetical protein